jgi:cytochrome bd-type quinol oxidase subunit 2
MGLLLVVLGLARGLYLDALPTAVNEDAAASVYDQVLSSLRTLLSVAFIVSLIVAFAAWISGPSRVPVRLRAATIGRHRDRVAT